MNIRGGLSWFARFWDRNLDRRVDERIADSSAGYGQGRNAVSGACSFAGIDDSLRWRAAYGNGFGAAFISGARRDQDWEPNRGATDGGMGRERGWESERAHFRTMEEVWTKRGGIDLGRRSGR